MLASRNEVSDEMPSFIDHHKTAVRSSNGGKRSRSAAPQQRRHRRGESIHGLAIHERMSAIELVIVLGTFLSIGCMSQGIDKAVNRESVIAHFRQWEFEVEVLCLTVSLSV